MCAYWCTIAKFLPQKLIIFVKTMRFMKFCATKIWSYTINTLSKLAILFLDIPKSTVKAYSDLCM